MFLSFLADSQNLHGQNVSLQWLLTGYRHLQKNSVYYIRCQPSLPYWLLTPLFTFAGLWTPAYGRPSLATAELLVVSFWWTMFWFQQRCLRCSGCSQALYGVVIYVLMRLPLSAWCGRWYARQTTTGYQHQTESPSNNPHSHHHHNNHHDQQQQQQQGRGSDVISLDSEQLQSKFAHDLSQQIIINSAQVGSLN